jgi:hypothetical protein
VKILRVTPNNRRKVFEVRTRGASHSIPYARVEPRPGRGDGVREVFVDPALGHEAFTFRLDSGREGSVHIEQVLDYNRDPNYLRDLLLYSLTLEAQRRLAESPLSRREIIRRLQTSPSQFYRLLDQTNYRKSIDQLLALLVLLDCSVELVVEKKPEGAHQSPRGRPVRQTGRPRVGPHLPTELRRRHTRG